MRMMKIMVASWQATLQVADSRRGTGTRNRERAVLGTISGPLVEEALKVCRGDGMAIGLIVERFEISKDLGHADPVVLYVGEADGQDMYCAAGIGDQSERGLPCAVPH